VEKIWEIRENFLHPGCSGLHHFSIKINQKVDKHLDPGLYLPSFSCSIREIVFTPTTAEGMVERYGIL
jgi:hypothetical protein